MPRKRKTKPSHLASRRGRLERLEDRRVLAATPIQVLAAGLSGAESMALEVNGQEVRRWSGVGGDFDNRVFQTFDYTHPTTVTADDLAVRMVASAGAGKDLRVDGVRVNGVKYESESADTWSTGGWNNDLQAIVQEYGQSEILYANAGAFFFSSDSSSDILIRAAGATGTERMELRIDNQLVEGWSNIQGSYSGRTFWSYRYTHPTKVSPEQIKVDFVNDGLTPDGQDRNLRVDMVMIDGRRWQSESPNTFSTGTWVDGTIEPNYPASEQLQGNGYFQYSSVAQGGTAMIVAATGASLDETFAINAEGRRAAEFEIQGGSYSNRVFEPYAFVHPRDVSLSDIDVEFLNDAPGRDLRVDAIVVDGVRTEAEDATTFSDATWVGGLGFFSGFVQDERLHRNGALEFGQDPSETGVLSLGATQYTVIEGEEFATIEIVRTGGSRGGVTLDYTTVDGTAIAGQDYTATSGTAVIRDGRGSVTVQIPILDDTQQEGAEAFNVAADRVTGGAFLGQPRTTTVTLLDDDAPNLGDGIGLRGEYFAGRGFGSRLLERTDSQIDFEWGTGSPSPQVSTDDFSVRWTGTVQPLYTETYTFETRTDDGVRLWVDGQRLIDEWQDQAPTAHTGTITLTAGVEYDIRMEYYERGGGAVAELRWSSPSQTREIVPQTQLDSELVIPDDGQFSSETLIASGLQRPTGIDFVEVDGSDYMYISQQDGRVRLAINGVLQSGVVVDYRTPVNNVRDRGLLGMAVHPNLQQNPYLYLLYTYDPPETAGQSGLAAPDKAGNRGSRLTRLTLDASNDYRTVVPGSDVVLLGTNSTWPNISRPDLDSTNDNSIPPSGLLPNGEWIEDILVTDSQSHTIGALDFGSDGSLFVTNGDGTSYGRVDPRTTRVQDLDSLSGKMLRINPLTGDGYADNPFYTGDPTDDRSKVYNYGLRNPFTLAVDPSSGVPYTGDVGWNAWEEINGGRGQNFGWPFYEGGAGNGSQGGDAVNRRTGGYRDLPEAQAFYANGGDAAATPPAWSRSHSAGGVAIVLGDFYTGDEYPSRFDNTLFFTDFGDPTVRAVQLDANGVVTDELVVMGSVGQVIEMSMGPDGRMYYVDLRGQVGRINYQPASPSLVIASTEATDAGPTSFVPAERGAFAATVRPTVPPSTRLAADGALELMLLESMAPTGRPTTETLGDRETEERDQSEEVEEEDDRDEQDAAFASL